MTAVFPQGERLSIRSRAVWALQTAFALFAIWLAFNGLAGWPAGLLAAIIGAGLAAWLAEHEPFGSSPLRLLEFVAFFLVESFRGGFDIALRSFHPRMPVSPTFFKHDIALPQGQPTTLLISVISLLPGTLSAELLLDGDDCDDDGDDNDPNVSPHERAGHRAVIVHSLTDEGEQAVARLERRIARLFSLEDERR